MFKNTRKEGGILFLPDHLSVEYDGFKIRNVDIECQVFIICTLRLGYQDCIAADQQIGQVVSVSFIIQVASASNSHHLPFRKVRCLFRIYQYLLCRQVGILYPDNPVLIGYPRIRLEAQAGVGRPDKERKHV